MINAKETCHHCGASMMMNSYSMNKTLARALAKIAINPGKLIRECGLSRGEYANCTKLKFWGFIEKNFDGNWSVTDLGKSFLRGEVSAFKNIKYFRNRIVESEGQIFIQEILKNPESKQKYREMMEPFVWRIS